MVIHAPNLRVVKTTSEMGRQVLDIPAQQTLINTINHKAQRQETTHQVDLSLISNPFPNPFNHSFASATY
jgi:hypothetical protein